MNGTSPSVVPEASCASVVANAPFAHDEANAPCALLMTRKDAIAEAWFPERRALTSCGIAIEAKNPMMPTTISSSIRVKPRQPLLAMCDHRKVRR